MSALLLSVLLRVDTNIEPLIMGQLNTNMLYLESIMPKTNIEKRKGSKAMCMPLSTKAFEGASVPIIFPPVLLRQ